MVEHHNGISPPKGVENHVALLRRGDEPTIEAIRRRLEVMKREALHSHAMPDELARALLMCALQDCCRALDGKVSGATPQFVTETLDSLSESLMHVELIEPAMVILGLGSVRISHESPVSGCDGSQSGQDHHGRNNKAMRSE